MQLVGLQCNLTRLETWPHEMRSELPASIGTLPHLCSLSYGLFQLPRDAVRQLSGLTTLRLALASDSEADLSPLTNLRVRCQPEGRPFATMRLCAWACS